MAYTTDNPTRVGATVRALREANGWTVTKFADVLGMNRSHLANIEAGRKRLTPEKARKIADTLQIPLAAIVTPYAIEDVTG